MGSERIDKRVRKNLGSTRKSSADDIILQLIDAAAAQNTVLTTKDVAQEFDNMDYAEALATLKEMKRAGLIGGSDSSGWVPAHGLGKQAGADVVNWTCAVTVGIPRSEVDGATLKQEIEGALMDVLGGKYGITRLTVSEPR